MQLPFASRLSTQMMLVVMVGLLLVVGGFALMGFQTVQESTERTLQERLIIAQITADRADDWLRRQTDLLQLRVAKAALDPKHPSRVTNRQSLHAIREHFGSTVHYIALVNQQGIVVWTEPYLEDVIGLDISQGNCTKGIFAGADFKITKVFDVGRADPTAAIMVGLKDGETSVCGLVYAALNLSHPEIVDLLNPLGLGQTGGAEIVDQNGVILASTFPEQLWQQRDHHEHFATLIQQDQTMVGTCHNCHGASRVQGRQADVIAFAPMATAPWGVVVRQSETEALIYSQVMKRRILFFGAGTFLIALLGTGLITRIVVRPLQVLVEACRRITAGDLSQPMPPIGSGEIGVLARSFDTMRAKLKASLEEIEHWNRDLEQIVEQRTAELEKAEQGRRDLVRKLVAAQEEERRRLARELHDETSQALTALTVGLETIAISPAENVEDVKDRLAPIKSLAVEMLDEIQRIILDLRPAILDDLGLVEAIDWYAESRLKPQGVQINLAIVGRETRLPSEVETAVFRLAQETITNISKHTQAENVNISLDFRPLTVVLDIEDDGYGFDPVVAMDRGQVQTSFGLLGMKERAALFGGTMQVQSQPGQGTKITVEIPWKTALSQRNGKNGQNTSFTGGRPRYSERRVEGPVKSP